MNKDELTTDIKIVASVVGLLVESYLGLPVDKALASALKEKVNHPPPYTRHEVEQIHQLGYASDACKTDPSGSGCIAALNKCNGNQTKPVNEQTKGCFSGMRPIYDTDGKTIIGVVNELTGYNSLIPPGKDSSQAVYSPIERSRGASFRENRNIYRANRARTHRK